MPAVVINSTKMVMNNSSMQLLAFIDVYIRNFCIHCMQFLVFSNKSVIKILYTVKNVLIKITKVWLPELYWRSTGLPFFSN